MSTSNIDALMLEAKADPGLTERLRRAAHAADLVRIGKERGHDFTEDEVAAYLESRSESALSEQELEAVMGGSSSGAHVALSLGDGGTYDQTDGVSAGDLLLHRWQRSG